MGNMTLFDILSLDERIIVYSNREDSIIVTWNQSCTIQFWMVNTSYPSLFTELEVITLSDVPKSFKDCRDKVKLIYNDSTGMLFRRTTELGRKRL